MAVQVVNGERAGNPERPRLYVIDFDRARRWTTTLEAPRHPQLLTLRRRRMIRRLRQAGLAASWAGGAAALVLLLLGGLAGLR